MSPVPHHLVPRENAIYLLSQLEVNGTYMVKYLFIPGNIPENKLSA